MEKYFLNGSDGFIGSHLVESSFQILMCALVQEFME